MGTHRVDSVSAFSGAVAGSDVISGVYAPKRTLLSTSLMQQSQGKPPGAAGLSLRYYKGKKRGLWITILLIIKKEPFSYI